MINYIKNEISRTISSIKSDEMLLAVITSIVYFMGINAILLGAVLLIKLLRV